MNIWIWFFSELVENARYTFHLWAKPLILATTNMTLVVMLWLTAYQILLLWYAHIYIYCIYVYNYMYMVTLIFIILHWLYASIIPSCYTILYQPVTSIFVDISIDIKQSYVYLETIVNIINIFSYINQSLSLICVAILCHPLTQSSDKSLS